VFINETERVETSKRLDCLYKRRQFELNIITQQAGMIFNITRYTECGSSTIKLVTHLKTIYEFHDSFIFECQTTATMIDDALLFYWAPRQHLLIKMYCLLSSLSLPSQAIYRYSAGRLCIRNIFFFCFRRSKTSINHHNRCQISPNTRSL
jgi:hypothetical protein